MCLRAWKESWFSKDHELAGALWDSEHIDLSPKWEVKIAGAGEVLGHTSGFGPQTLLVMCSLKAAEWGADLVEVGTVLHQSVPDTILVFRELHGQKSLEGCSP